MSCNSVLKVCWLFLKPEMKIKMQTAWVLFEDHLLERSQWDIVAADRTGVCEGPGAKVSSHSAEITYRSVLGLGNSLQFLGSGYQHPNKAVEKLWQRTKLFIVIPRPSLFERWTVKFKNQRFLPTPKYIKQPFAVWNKIDQNFKGSNKSLILWFSTK